MRGIVCFRLIVVLWLGLSTAFAQQAAEVYSEDKTAIFVTADKPNIMIQLTSNPTTGYSWYLQSYNERILIPIKQFYQPPNTKLIGASGKQIWTFTTRPNAFAVPQRTTLQFVYARPWESGEPAKQVTFSVSIAGH